MFFGHYGSDDRCEAQLHPLQARLWARMLAKVGGLGYTNRLLRVRVVSSILLCAAPVWGKALHVSFNAHKLNTLYRRTAMCALHCFCVPLLRSDIDWHFSRSETSIYVRPISPLSTKPRSRRRTPKGEIYMWMRTSTGLNWTPQLIIQTVMGSQGLLSKIRGVENVSMSEGYNTLCGFR